MNDLVTLFFEPESVIILLLPKSRLRLKTQDCGRCSILNEKDLFIEQLRYAIGHYWDGNSGRNMSMYSRHAMEQASWCFFSRAHCSNLEIIDICLFTNFKA